MTNATTTTDDRYVWVDHNPAHETYHVVRAFAETFRCGPPLVVSGRFRLTIDGRGRRYRIEKWDNVHRIFSED